MARSEQVDLRELLIDAHAHFFFLKGDEAMRVKLWQILPDALVIEMPVGAPMRKTVLGYIPTLDGNGVYEVEGKICTEPRTDQMPNTICVEVDSNCVRRINRRLYPRVNFTPPIEGSALPDSGKKAISIRIVNFSAGGLRIEAVSEMSAATVYNFRFKIETEDKTHELKLPGMIVYEFPIADGKSYGIRFGQKPEVPSALEEAPVEMLEQTVSLLNLVNKLIVSQR